MKNYILITLALLCSLSAFGQNNIKKTAAIAYTNGVPTYTVNTNSSAELAVDTVTSRLYWYNRNSSSWVLYPRGFDIISGSVPPAYTPRDNQSLFAINAANETYYYTGATWVQIGGSGGGGIYGGSGNASDGTVATIVGDFEFSGPDTSSFTVTTGTSRGGQIFSNLAGASLIHRDTSSTTSLELSGTGATFNFNDGSTDRLTINARDARYGADYSATYSARSLVDKGYVDSHSGGITLGSANQVLGVNAAGTANEYKTVNGTSNQITVTHAANSITLATPQNIHTAATPTFGKLTLTAGGFSPQLNINSTGLASIARLSNEGSNILMSASKTGYVTIGLNGDTVLTQPLEIYFSNTNEAIAHTTNDLFGRFVFSGSTGSATPGLEAARIAAYADGTQTGSSNPAYLSFAVGATDSTTLLPVFRIYNAGARLLYGRSLRFYDSDNTNYVSFKAAATGSLTSDFSYTLPTSYGTSGYQLTTDGAGSLSWAAAGSGGGSETNAPPTIRPSQLTAKTNNWNPTGYSTTVTQTIELSGDASFRFITGMEGATRDGVLKTLQNEGSNCVGIARLNTASDADNRFFDEIILYPHMAATFRYDSIEQYWKLTSSTKANISYTSAVEGSLRDNTGTVTSADNGTFTFTTGGGTFSAGSATAGVNPRYIQFSTSTAATAFPTMHTKTGVVHILADASYLRMKTRIRIEDLSTATEDFDLHFGFEGNIDSVQSEGAFISYEYQENSGGFTLKTHDGASPTTTNAGSAISADTWYTLEIVYYPFGEVAAFIGDGGTETRYATTSTIPEAIAGICFLQMDKDNGTTARLVYMTGFDVQGVYVNEN